MTTKNSLQDLQIWLDDLAKDDSQLTFDFDTNNTKTVGYGQAAQPALTISSIGTDTISLTDDWNMSSGAIGAATSAQYNYTYGGGSSYPAITIGPNTLNNGPILTTGTNGINWNDIGHVSPGALHVKGNAEFEGDVKIKGKSIADTLEKLEERLAILKPNPELEDRWEELKDLSKRYKELEKELIEKEKMWDILKR
jgi:hypothetical protein